MSGLWSAGAALAPGTSAGAALAPGAGCPSCGAASAPPPVVPPPFASRAVSSPMADPIVVRAAGAAPEAREEAGQDRRRGQEHDADGHRGAGQRLQDLEARPAQPAQQAAESAATQAFGVVARQPEVTRPSGCDQVVPGGGRDAPDLVDQRRATSAACDQRTRVGDVLVGQVAARECDHELTIVAGMIVGHVGLAGMGHRAADVTHRGRVPSGRRAGRAAPGARDGSGT